MLTSGMSDRLALVGPVWLVPSYKIEWELDGKAGDPFQTLAEIGIDVQREHGLKWLD